MVNEGPHSNGSQFAITFGEATYLDGYQNVVGELVEGDSLLKEIEESCCKLGKVHAQWTVTAAGKQF